LKIIIIFWTTKEMKILSVGRTNFLVVNKFVTAKVKKVETDLAESP